MYTSRDHEIIFVVHLWAPTFNSIANIADTRGDPEHFGAAVTCRSWWRSHLITLQHGDLARELESARGELFHGWHRHFAVLPQV
ncbi:hypothetical protein PI126_g7900 [Phytophthora idaei]|nr:hypothetical protein PI126_g7900 [Phytophthora idaei]